MKKKLLLVGAAAAALTLAAPAMASAAPPYTVAVGGSTAAGNHAFTATAVGGIAFAVPLNAMFCTSAGASGSIHSGTGKSGLAPDHLATISSTTWSGCTEQFGTPLTVTHSGAWKLETNDTSVTAAATDQVDGWISGISARVTDSTGLCDFTVTGSADGHFDEATQRLVVDETGDGSLSVTAVVSDCLGSISVGDPASFNGTYNVSVPNGAVNVS
ncbi:hypothetical protein ACIO3S_18315 [Nocardioides sp. NPDC087217]|uniref:hypothetical protein n=1 Tax=Nocardioides sp. NPDC087217 TaxID=3364335 RepID=UPI0037F14B81